MIGNPSYDIENEVELDPEAAAQGRSVLRHTGKVRVIVNGAVRFIGLREEIPDDVQAEIISITSNVTAAQAEAVLAAGRERELREKAWMDRQAESEKERLERIANETPLQTFERLVDELIDAADNARGAEEYGMDTELSECSLQRARRALLDMGAQLKEKG